MAKGREVGVVCGWDSRSVPKRSVGRSLTVGRYGRYGNPKKSSSVHPRHARALTVGRYGRYGNPKKSSSVHPRHARALTVARYGRYGKPKSQVVSIQGMSVP